MLNVYLCIVRWSIVEHYLDNSATTVASLAAAKKAFEMMTENYANPSSLHYGG